MAQIFIGLIHVIRHKYFEKKIFVRLEIRQFHKRVKVDECRR